jgi:restriction endonuclease S subunit
VSNRWLYHYLDRANLNQHATGTAQPGLAVQNLYKVSVNLPPLTEQKIIVAAIEKIETKIIELERELANISEEKEGVFRKYL